MDTNKKYIVKNRSASYVVYNLPERNLRREFAPGESRSWTSMNLRPSLFSPADAS